MDYWTTFLATAVSAVSLGDSYAVNQTEPLANALEIPVTEIAQYGAFAAHYLNNFDELVKPVVESLPGPVLVFINAGTNDERNSVFLFPSRTVALNVDKLTVRLLLLRSDLLVIRMGYNGTAADICYPQYLIEDGLRHRYVETNHLDNRIKFVDLAHPDENGFRTRIRYVLHEINKKVDEE